MTLELDSLLRDRYRIQELLGQGGMGAVYRALDDNLGVEVAIKENLFSTPEAERQFKREATLLASLRHPNLPRVTDHFVVPGQGQYLVMDFIPGEDARTLLERAGGPLPQAEVLRWARSLLDALGYLHNRTQPIIHRDIKPGNLKITPEGRAVLVDFGLAKVHDTAHSTTVGAKALTPGFAPPEQYGLGRTDPRTDLYALAATLYALLTNTLPADSLERAMGNVQLTPIRDLNSAVSPEVALAIEKGLAIKPEDRFLSAAEFSTALAAAPTVAAPAPVTVVGSGLAATSTVPASGPTAKASPTLPAQGRFGWAWPAFIVVVLLLGAGGVGLWATGGYKTILAALAPPSATVPAVVSVPTETLPPTVAETEQPPTSTRAASPTLTSPPEATATDAPSPTVTPVPLTATPAATPRGGGLGQIAFVSERAGAPQIFTMGVDGSAPTQLTFIPDGACQPEWSPDGESLLFISPCSGKDTDYPRAAIYHMRADGSDVRFFISLGVGSVFDADWSEAGIVFTYLESNQPRLWTASGSGTDTKQISQARADDEHASWGPDGDKLVFVNTSRIGVPTLMWMFTDGTFNGSSPDQVSRDQSASTPAWSPLGDLVAYIVSQQVWVVKWDAKGFNAVQLTNRGPNADPAWSPDGLWLTFESWRDAANHDIYIMTSNGGLQTRLTEDPAADYQPAWRP